MSVVQFISDGLKNVVANLGTRRDKSAHTTYIVDALSSTELLNAYRTSWLARAIVDYPAEDATRKWRMWRADADQITKIETVEKDLRLQKRVQDALVAARLYGGAAIYINTADGQQDQPLRPGADIKSLVVLTNNSLAADEVVRDIDSAYYGEPEHYFLTSGKNDTMARIHASRLVIFRGAALPDDIGISTNLGNRWGGDSVLQSTLDSIKQTDATMANIASLVFEAKVDVFKFEGFAQLLAEAGGDAKVLSRLTSQAAMKGINGAVVIDTKDDYEQKTANFAGLPDVVTKFQEVVSGAAGMPVTRLFGRASAALSGRGEGDERVYYDRVGHDQTTEIQPAMSLLDDCIIYQALGSRPDTVYYEWTPLQQLTSAERAEIFVKTANAARALAGSNAGEVIPLDALSDSLVNELTEQGVLPGLDQKIKLYGSLSEQGGFIGDDAELFTDAAPRPLYVSRKVLNAIEILKHYKDQGLTNLIGADDMHVTVIYSRTPVDWLKMGESWNNDLVISEGGARVTELFGPEGDTVVLSFISSDLSYRHESMVERGASWDWPDYQPHISMSYEYNGNAESVKPWVGEIKLGPEIFEEVNEDWRSE